MKALINSYSRVMPRMKKQQVTRKNFRIVTYKPSNSTTTAFTNSHGINERILGLLDSFKKLKDNWDYDDAKAPGSEVINKAEQITSMLQIVGQKIYHAAPGPNSEIMLDVRSNKGLKSFEIIIYDDRMNIVFISGEELPRQDVFSFSKLKDYFHWLNG